MVGRIVWTRHDCRRCTFGVRIHFTMLYYTVLILLCCTVPAVLSVRQIEMGEGLRFERK